MINRALKLLRTYHQLTQVDLAKKIGLSNSYLSELEAGLKSPSVDVIERYSTIFKVPVSSIFLFSEAVQGDKKASERIRIYAADKVLRILEWLEEKESIGS